MAPWDENIYFEIPVPSYPNILPNSEQQLVKQNPRRVGLMVGTANAASGLTISPDSQLKHSAGPTTKGFPVNSGASSPVGFLQREWGVLVQLEWWVANSTATASVITVIELVLYKWSELTEEQQNDERLQSLVRSINGASRLPRNPIEQPESEEDYIFSAGWRNGYS